MPDGSLTGSPDVLDLVALFKAADAWALLLITHHLTNSDLQALCSADKACEQWVLQAVPRATASLRAPNKLGAAAWQHRLLCAERGLVARGPGQVSRLVMWQDTEHEVARQGLLSIAPAAGSVVSHLEVRVANWRWVLQGLDDGAQTPWLQALPSSFPNLRALRLDRVSGCLPPPHLLPHVRELHVVLCPQPAQRRAGPQPEPGPTPEQLYSSVAAYTAQLTSLGVDQRDDHPMAWSLIFTTPTTTLTHLSTNQNVTDALVAALCAHGGSVTHLSCHNLSHTLTRRHSTNEWGLKELTVRLWAGAEELARLPRSKAGALTIGRASQEKVSARTRGPQYVHNTGNQQPTAVNYHCK